MKQESTDKNMDNPILKRVADWESKHPYAFSLSISVLFVLYILFRSPSLEVLNEDMRPTDQIQFVNIDEIQAPKRVVKKDISTDKSDVSEDTTNVERARGTSDDKNAVDLAFMPNIAPPKLLKYKKSYPKSAKEMNIEATMQLEILISATGKVKDVKILNTRLSKALPEDIYNRLVRDFSKHIGKILRSAKFTPTIIEGKKSPVRTVVPFRFRLNS